MILDMVCLQWISPLVSSYLADFGLDIEDWHAVERCLGLLFSPVLITNCERNRLELPSLYGTEIETASHDDLLLAKWLPTRIYPYRNPTARDCRHRRRV